MQKVVRQSIIVVFYGGDKGGRECIGCNADEI